MKKILYITTIASTMNAFLVPHIEMLIDEGNIVDCACFLDKEIDKNLIEKGCKVFDIPFTRNPLDLENIKAFKDLIRIQKENQYDIVHVHTPVASVYGRLLKILFQKLKTIYTAHGFHFYKGAPKKKYLIFYSIEKLMSRFTDILITMNKEDFEVASNKFHAKKVFNINGVGVDIEKYSNKLNYDRNFRKSLDLKEDDFIITVIAELSERKNQMQVICAVQKLLERYNNIKLLLVGSGEKYDEFKEYIENNELNNNIKLLGYRNDIPNILAGSDVIALTSYHEGLPRNLMEAMVAKKPIVCTDIRGNNDLVKDNINGFLVKINDINSTMNNIEILYKDKELRKIMGEKGFSIIEKDYCLEKVLEQIKSILLNINKK